MENDKITEELRKFADTFKNVQNERKAVILIPTYEGFMVHEVTKEIGLHAVAAQALKDKAQAERPNEDSGLGLQHVSKPKGTVCDCQMSGTCRYEVIMHDKQEECRHKIAN